MSSDPGAEENRSVMYLLMMIILGPSRPDPEVLKALAEPVLPHYGPRWKSIYDDTTSDLRNVFGTTRNDVLLVPVPGQVAVEMSVVNLVGKGGTGFVCVNGTFSEDSEDDTRAIGANPVEIARSSRPSRPPKRWRASSTTQGRTWLGKTLLPRVHTETTTGERPPRPG